LAVERERERGGEPGMARRRPDAVVNHYPLDYSVIGEWITRAMTQAVYATPLEPRWLLERLNLEGTFRT